MPFRDASEHSEHCVKRSETSNFHLFATLENPNTVMGGYDAGRVTVRRADSHSTPCVGFRFMCMPTFPFTRSTTPPVAGPSSKRSHHRARHSDRQRLTAPHKLYDEAV